MSTRSNPTKITALPLRTVTTETGEVYVVEDRRPSGASGIVYRAHNQQEPSKEAAIKFYLVPIQAKVLLGTTAAVWGAEPDEEVYKNERAALMALRHPAIQHVLDYGTLENASDYFAEEKEFEVPPSNKVGFVVSRFIEGSSIKTWMDRLAAEGAEATSRHRYEIRTRIIRVLNSLAEALTYLHEVEEYQHSDISVENVLIDDTSQLPVLIDFGFAQIFAEKMIESTPKTRIRPFRFLNAPRELEAELDAVVAEGTNEVGRDVLRKMIFPGLDLYQFGRLLETLFASEAVRTLLTPLDIQFLQLITNELIVWDTARWVRTSEIAKQLRKLVDGYWSSAAAPHAPQLAPGQPVKRISLRSSTFLAPTFVRDIIETPSFRRLQQLKQLSLLDFIYPGATQTRMDHSLEAYSTAVEMVQHLVRSPRFTKLFDTTAVTELLICALLHDINHFPFLHYFQELDIAGGDKRNLFEHFINRVGETEGSTIAEAIADAGVNPETVINIFSQKHADLPDPRHQVIKSILDSGVDIDKLCYVQGDARSTGVPFGTGVDRRTLIASADILRLGSDDEHWHLCFEPKGLSAVESLLLARYWNFKQIYWHHTNRALGAMVSYVLSELEKAEALNLQSYIDATSSLTEAAAISYLDRLYAEKLKQPSILRDLVTRRGGLFKRLLSLRARVGGSARGPNETRRQTIVERLQKLPIERRASVLAHFQKKLNKVFPTLSARYGTAEPLVLLDIPGRQLEQQMGDVYVARVKLDGEPLELIDSPFIKTLKEEFMNLSRTIRLFLPGEVRDFLGKDRILAARVELEKALDGALREDGGNATNTVI